MYEEVEADQKATGQAMLMVIMGALATGIGSLTEGGWLGLIIGTIVGPIGWVIWAWLNYFLGTHLLKEAQTEGNWGQLARAMGFAYTPRLLAIFSLIPVPFLRALIFIAITI